jgi:hypothetical protein
MKRLVLTLVLLLTAMPQTVHAQQQAFVIDLAVGIDSPPQSCPGYGQVDSNNLEFPLLGCVEDSNGAPVDTSASDLHIEWRASQHVTLQSEPPETGADGTVATTARISEDGRHEIEMVLCSGDPCGEIGSSVVAIDRWTHSDPACAFNRTNCDGAVIRQVEEDRVFIAVGSSTRECMDRRPLLVKEERSGRDDILGVEQSRSDGETTARVRKWWNGRFYVVAPRWRAETPEGDVTCERERSGSIRIR